MASKLHEECVDYLRKTIGQEIGIDGWRPTRGKFKHLIPDLVFGHQEDGNLIVVEIGFTSAEKILKYFTDETIIEIRWYTKKADLVAQWIRNDGQWNQKSFDQKTQLGTFENEKDKWPGVYQRGKQWWIEYRHKGKRYRESIGPDKKLAIDVLCKRRVEIRENKFDCK